MARQPHLIPFVPDRQHLNPKFEGYKLQLFPEDTNLRRVVLPKPGVNIPQIPASTNLPFRALHFNYLFNGYHDGCALYIDSESVVTMVDIDLKSKATQFHKLVQL